MEVMNLPLIIGIENGRKKGFSKEEIQFTNGFNLGMLCMSAGIGVVIPFAAPKYWTQKHFLGRLIITDEILGLKILPPWFNLEFVERMEQADWSANIGFDDRRTWKNNMWRRTMEKAYRTRKLKEKEVRRNEY